MIEVSNLGKRYRLGVINRGMLYKDLQSWWARLRGREDPNSPVHALRRPRGVTGEYFWAFRDVSFSVRPGEIVGIVGRNGAGKSTLLKVMSQITAPSEGEFRLNGRVASLLEVGTGFHGELTGRENIYLNGAILGMSRSEVRSCLEQITEFAEIGPFLDTPVKRYSSGMYVRLAFSVAAHLQPDILIVDEVLAVGDAAFQKKCLGRMDEAALKEGRTILFVSHNMTAVRSLCSRALLLKDGRLIGDGPAGEIVDRYLEEGSLRAGKIGRKHHEGSGRLRVTDIHFETPQGGRIEELPVGEPVNVRITYTAENLKPSDRIVPGVGVVGSEAVFNNYSCFGGKSFGPVPKEGSFVFHWPRVDLVPGQYAMVVRIVANGDHHNGELLDMPPAVSFHVAPRDFHGSGRSIGLNYGAVLVRGDWTVD
jgi:lipopolysaccharide transport system ATP-binding protein